MRSERTRMSSERGRGRDRHVARPGERDCRQLLSAPAPHAGGNANDGSSFSLPRGRRPRRFWSEARGALRVVVARGIRWRFGGAFACRRKRPGRPVRVGPGGETVKCRNAGTRTGKTQSRTQSSQYIQSILIIVHNATVRQRADGGRAAARGRVRQLATLRFSQSSERSARARHSPHTAQHPPAPHGTRNEALQMRHATRGRTATSPFHSKWCDPSAARPCVMHVLGARRDGRQPPTAPGRWHERSAKPLAYGLLLGAEEQDPVRRLARARVVHAVVLCELHDRG